MKLYPIEAKLYKAIQINRSVSKFKYCKVSFKYVIKYKKLLKNLNFAPNKILCLGTRNGREVDLFRYVFFFNKLALFVSLFEIKKYGYRNIFRKLESFRRSNVDEIFTTQAGVWGVEINPLGSRKDIYIEDFSKLNDFESESFDLIFSNSIDQSLDPFTTSNEWWRILKKEGYAIIEFNDSIATETDPTGSLSIRDIIEIFPGELIFYQKNFSLYNTAIIRKMF